MFLLLILLGSVVLLFVHIFTQGILTTRELGLKWNMGSRDGDSRPRSILAGRAARASANYRETYPAFLILALLLFGLGNTGLGLLGAMVWFLARLVYLPVYLSGISYLRSVAWLAAFLGLVLMFVSVFLPMLTVINLR